MRARRRLGPSLAVWALGLVAGIRLAAAQPAAQSAAPAGAAEACRLTLDLHVVDAHSHQPLADALISTPTTLLGLTDVTGHLIIGGQCPGTLHLHVERAGYGPEVRDLSVTRSALIELELAGLPSETIVIAGDAAPLPDTRSETKLSGEALARTRGKSLAEALATVAGVGQMQAGTGVAKPMIRGQFGRRLAMVVDGVPHRSQDWGIDHAPEIDAFSAETLTVVRGATGVLFGGNATGGAVAVDSAALRREPGTVGELHLIGLWDRGGGGALRLQGMPQAHPAWAWNVEASGKQFAAARTPTYALQNTGVRDGSVGVTVGYRRRKLEQTLGLRRYQATMGVCLCLRMESLADFQAQVALGQPIDAALYRGDFAIERPYQQVAHDTLSSRTRVDLGEAGRLDVRYALQRDERQEYDIVRTSTAPQFDFALLTHDLIARFDHALVHISEHLHLDGELGVAAMWQAHTYRGLPFVPSHQAWLIAPYASERLLGHDYDLELGLRYEVTGRTATIDELAFTRMRRDEQIAEAACTPNAAGETVACDTKFAALAASLGGIYAAAATLDLKGNLSVTARAPNLDELYLNGTSPTFPVYGVGDASLGLETTYAASLGVVRHEPPQSAVNPTASLRLTGEASVHASLVDDYAYFAPVLDASGAPTYEVLIRGAFPRFATRAVRALFWGGEASARLRAHARLELGGQVTVVRGRNLTDDGYLMFVPADTARATATFTHPLLWTLPNLRATLGATAVRRQDRADDRADLAPAPRGYVIVDAGVEATFAADNARTGALPVRVALEATNLLGTRYRDYTSLMRYFADQPGRRIMLRVSATWGPR